MKLTLLLITAIALLTGCQQKETKIRNAAMDNTTALITQLKNNQVVFNDKYAMKPMTINAVVDKMTLMPSQALLPPMKIGVGPLTEVRLHTQMPTELFPIYCLFTMDSTVDALVCGESITITGRMAPVGGDDIELILVDCCIGDTPLPAAAGTYSVSQ